MAGHDADGSSGVWITGPSRSGTSMTAGLFAHHGVFFGDCTAPADMNRKGFFENVWLKEFIANPQLAEWPGNWFAELERQGWNGEPWGAKCGPERWSFMADARPSLIVLCWRPIEQILASRSRINWKAQRQIVERAWQRMREIQATARCYVVSVKTDALAFGDYSTVLPAFRLLGVPFDRAVADRWIEPELWHH